MEAVLTRKELADRWKVTVKTIVSWENNISLTIRCHL